MTNDPSTPSANATPLRVVLVDDHVIVRAGLAYLLESDVRITVVGQAECGEEALMLCLKQKPDMVLMDVMMPGMGGRGAIEAIRRYHPEVNIVAITASQEAGLDAELMALGAKAVLPKSIDGATLIETLVSVHASRQAPVCTPALYRPNPAAAPAHLLHRQVEAPYGALQLGDQQRRVLALLTKGYTNKDIAEYLGISIPTARYHVSALLLRLGVANRAEAAAAAVRLQLVSDQDF